MAENFDDIEKRLRAQAKLGEDLRQSSAAMAGSMKDYLELQFRLNKAKKEEAKLEEKVNKLREDSKGVMNDELRQHEELLKKVKKENSELEKGSKILKSQAFNVKNMAVAVSKDLLKGLKSVSKEVKSISLGYLEQDKAIRRVSINLGIVGKRQDQFLKTVYRTSITTQQWGVNASEIATMYSSYADSIGRLVPLTEQNAKVMSLMAKGTSLGADGASEMSSNMEVFGYSITKTAKYVENVSNMSESMGVTSSKTLKILNQNLKKAQGFRFKDGQVGMARMAALSAKLRMDMSEVMGFAEKLWDPEGSIEAAASLQMMGGAFAQMADPLQLLYKGRNNPEQLLKDLSSAAASTVQNMGKGVYEIPAMELQRLKQVADATGVSFDTLVESAKTVRRQSDISAMLSPNITKDDRDLVSTLAEWSDEKGGFTVSLDGQTQTLVKNLSPGMVATLKSQAKTLEQRSKDAQSFDERLKNIILTFKALLLPFLNGLDRGLRPLLEKMLGSSGFSENMVTLGAKMEKWGEKFGTWIGTSLPGFIETIKGIGTTLSGLFGGGEKGPLSGLKEAGFNIIEGIKTLGNFLGPKGSLAGLLLILFPKTIKDAFTFGYDILKGVGGALYDRFFARGSSPMNPMFVSGGGMGGPDGTGNSITDMLNPKKGGLKNLFKKGGIKNLVKSIDFKGLGKMAKGAGWMSAIGAAVDLGSNLSDDKLSTGDALTKTLDQHKFLAAGAAIGSIVPGLGTAIGAGIGGMIDMFVPEVGTYGADGKKSDGGFGNRGVGGSRATTMMDGTSTPNGHVITTPKGEVYKTHMKDYLMVGQPTGSGGGSSNDMSINGTLMLKGDGFEKDLLKDPLFLNALTKQITFLMNDQNR